MPLSFAQPRSPIFSLTYHVVPEGCGEHGCPCHERELIFVRSAGSTNVRRVMDMTHHTDGASRWLGLTALVVAFGIAGFVMSAVVFASERNHRQSEKGE